MCCAELGSTLVSIISLASRGLAQSRRNIIASRVARIANSTSQGAADVQVTQTRRCGLRLAFSVVVRPVTVILLVLAVAVQARSDPQAPKLAQPALRSQPAWQVRQTPNALRRMLANVSPSRASAGQRPRQG